MATQASALAPPISAEAPEAQDSVQDRLLAVMAEPPCLNDEDAAYMNRVVQAFREASMEIPPELVGQASELYQSLKTMTFGIITECHDPDYQAMMENAHNWFNRAETEAFQLTLFEDEAKRKAA